MVRAPSAAGTDTEEPHAALLGEFEGVGQQVLEHLLQTLGVGDQAAARCGSDIDIEVERGFPPRDGRAATTASSILPKKTSSASTDTVPDSILDRSRMSLIRFSRSVPAP
jgi:hypothetical protein